MRNRGTRVGGPTLFGRSLQGLRPRFVLGLLLGGSFAGVWLTHLGRPPAVRAFWWVVVTATVLLAGGLYWRLVLFDAADFDDADTRRWVRARWRRLEAVAVPTFALAGLGALVLGIPDTSGLGPAVFGAGLLLAPAVWVGVRWTASVGRDRWTARLRTLLFSVVLASLGGLAWLETGTGAVDWLVRVGHLGAVGLWLGGATWHNAVLLPSMRSGRPVAGLKRQARRFRRHLPLVVPLVFLTGGHQALQLVGPSLSALLGSPVGHLVAAKLLVLLVLTGLVVATLRRAATD